MRISNLDFFGKMPDSLDLLQKILEEHSTNKSLQNLLMELMESLYQELESERSTIDNLQKQIENLLKQENSGITSKYAAVKEKCEALKNQCSSLKNENEDLNIQLIAKNEEMKKILAEKERELQNDYIVRMEKKEEELRKKEQEIEMSRRIYEKKQQEFYTEIQTVEASSALELDKIESRLRKQLAESNQKFKDAMDTCGVLRNELMSTKEQFATYKFETNQKMLGLQKQLRDFRQQSASDAEKTQNNVEEFAVEDRSNTSTCSKYQPLDIDHYKTNYVMANKSASYKKPPIFRSSGKFLSDSIKTVNKQTSQQKDLSERVTPVRPIPKKRRLFNPEDLTYLNPDINSENE